MSNTDALDRPPVRLTILAFPKEGPDHSVSWCAQVLRGDDPAANALYATPDVGSSDEAIALVGDWVAAKARGEGDGNAVSTVDELSHSCDGWMETARQHCRNEAYYRGLVVAVGEMLGPDAYTADDGSRSQDVLCAKVPELVGKLLGALGERS